MKKKGFFIGILLISISLFISACTPNESPNDNGDDNSGSDSEDEISIRDERIAELEQTNFDLEEQVAALEERIDELEASEENTVDQRDSLLVTMANVLEILNEENMEDLEEYIHPEKGVRFSAYPYVDLEEDIVLMKDEIAGAYDSSETYIWGTTDGEGADIDLSFKDYYERYVYDQDFLNAPLIGYNTILSSGNTIDNVEDAYPEAEFYEMYFEGFNEDYAGQDWKSLKLVFEEQDNKWYLIGVIHGEWTI